MIKISQNQDLAIELAALTRRAELSGFPTEEMSELIHGLSLGHQQAGNVQAIALQKFELMVALSRQLVPDTLI